MFTLKQLRKIKGLTQAECARLVGVPLRTYQNYENEKEKVNSYKYYEIMKKVVNYGQDINEIFRLSDVETIYSTDVVIGDDLNRLINSVKNFRKRDCYLELEHFINNDYTGNVCILYGLRRTGKTTLLLQLAESLPLNETAYINIKNADTMGLLRRDIERLRERGIKYFLIDEITLMEDFINVSSVLSDIYSMMGLKIILSGTDSLGFLLAAYNELYDRAYFIHTTYISYKEFSYLLDKKSIDDYIEFGGTLLKENLTYQEYQIKKKELVFSNSKNTKLYIDTAIAQNIQNSLMKDSIKSRYSRLKHLFNEDELTNVINRIIEDMNHEFALKIIERRFKSHDFGSAKELLVKHDNRFYDIFDRINVNEMLDRFKEIISVKEKEELKVKIEEYHINEIKKYLYELDLIYNSSLIYEDGDKEEHIIFTQPGMRYSLVKALVNSLINDNYFSTLDSKDRDYIIKKILEDIKGRMLEDIITLDLSKKKPNHEVFKFVGEQGEIDIVSVNKDNYSVELYEVKHSSKIDKKQYRHLVNDRITKLIESRFGKIISRNVLYRGKNTTVDNINYINVEEFLKNL